MQNFLNNNFHTTLMRKKHSFNTLFFLCELCDYVVNYFFVAFLKIKPH
jgi:hypothetical protein